MASQASTLTDDLEEELAATLEEVGTKAPRPLGRGLAAGLAGLGVLAVLAGGYAAASREEGLPSHDERVAYMLSEHRDEQFTLGYKPHFVSAWGWSSERQHLWLVLQGEGDPKTREVLGVVDGHDREDAADGTLDWAYATMLGGGLQNSCFIEVDLLPEGMQDELDSHYRLGTGAFYRYFTEGRRNYGGEVGQDFLLAFYRTCRDLQR